MVPESWRKNPVTWHHVVLMLLSSLGFISAGQLAYQHVQAGNACPELVLMPLCYLVALAYGLIMASVLIRKQGLFYAGWLPVFLLALAGTLGTLLGHDVCPKTALGWPKCMLSLILASLILLAFLLQKYKKMPEIKQ